MTSFFEIRPTSDEVFLLMASSMSTRGTCYRRQVGCVLVDGRQRILSTGFNGPPPDWPHCRYDPANRCEGAEAQSGTGLDQCDANHAEQNALAHCLDRDRIHTCYTTTSPCVICTKELLHTPCRRIVFIQEYPQPRARELWTRHPLRIKTESENFTVPRTWEIKGSCYHPNEDHTAECCLDRRVKSTVIIASSPK